MIIMKIFNEFCGVLEGSNPDFNEIYLKSVRKLFMDRMSILGFTFLKDVYDAIGFEITKESCILGWHKDMKNNDFIKMDINKITDVNAFEIIFECYPILDYLKEEDGWL